ncbi:DUF6538 domain-containing protein [Donghicola sp. XS_ASV15]|uniref:DUF6538 domain-containing protein n=1 Tax=Donghicola sp. XS_ASV15 TaxID=3241295 RepID=UPI0035190442
MAETNLVPYAFVKDGIFYFSRRVPSDLSQHYLSSRIQYSLRTKVARVALARAQKAAQQLDEYWYHLRLKQTDLPGQHMLKQSRVGAAEQSVPSKPSQSNSVKLSEAVGIYQRLRKARDLHAGD